ncbi:helix-turn-helix transcriptional regulator [Bradyrhizobium sp. WSM 1738]|uniref:helix-turn-helix transcriptional regulator n=1 Tax=Bradyrhizobium hereditatis TaxID=2821405 RepID=UPI00406452AF|nr:helix-turn-helix transcriptional regulator [Bradyrhizobium hereditatis]
MATARKVSFDTTRNSLLFSRDDMRAALLTFNPQLAEMHERFAGEYLRHFDQKQVSYGVREAIIKRLPDGEPKRDEVAGELCMSERTLQRRLEEETSFLQLLDDTRRELADQYLGRLHLSLGQAAYLLGFSDQSRFSGPAAAGSTFHRGNAMLDRDEGKSGADRPGLNAVQQRKLSRRAVLKGVATVAGAAAGSGAIRGFPTIWTQETSRRVPKAIRQGGAEAVRRSHNRPMKLGK